jgi:hypothetical protein
VLRVHYLQVRGLPRTSVLREGLPIMLIVLFCLTQTFWPELVALIKDTQTHAAIMALGVFAFVLVRLWWQPLSTPRVVS